MFVVFLHEIFLYSNIIIVPIIIQYAKIANIIINFAFKTNENNKNY